MKELYQKCKTLGCRISKSSEKYFENICIEEDGSVCVNFIAYDRGEAAHWFIYLSQEDLDSPIEEVIKRHHQKDLEANNEKERKFKEFEAKEKIKKEEFEMQTYLRLKTKYEHSENK